MTIWCGHQKGKCLIYPCHSGTPKMYLHFLNIKIVHVVGILPCGKEQSIYPVWLKPELPMAYYLWPSSARSQGITSHATDLVLFKYCNFTTRSVNEILEISSYSFSFSIRVVNNFVLISCQAITYTNDDLSCKSRCNSHGRKIQLLLCFLEKFGQYLSWSHVAKGQENCGLTIKQLLELTLMYHRWNHQKHMWIKAYW